MLMLSKRLFMNVKVQGAEAKYKNKKSSECWEIEWIVAKKEWHNSESRLNSLIQNKKFFVMNKYASRS